MSAWSQHLRRLKQFLLRRGQTPEDAEDLVQEAFLRLHVFLKQGHEVREPEAFLVRTALNLVVDSRRREHRDLRSPEPLEELPLLDLAPSPEEIFSADQRLLQMRRVLDERVSARTREVFFLHRLEGFTHQEIAERMHMTLRTVENHIARAVTVVWMARQE